MTVENDVYKLIITQPKVDDMGKYTIEIGGITCSAYLTVEGTYGFIIALLQRTIHIFTIFKISFFFLHIHLTVQRPTKFIRSSANYQRKLKLILTVNMNWNARSIITKRLSIGTRARRRLNQTDRGLKSAKT